MIRQGHVYFLRCGDFVKIGFSTDHVSRIRALSTSNPIDPVLVALHEGSRSDESTFHRLLSAHRHRREWFRWCEDVKRLAEQGLPPELQRIDDNAPLTPNEALERACEKVGGQSALAELIGTSQTNVNYWIGRSTKGKNSKRGVPAEYVFAIEKATNGAVTRYDLRPDVFGPPEEEAAA